MIEILAGLSERDLLEAANALRSGRLLPPYSTVSLQRVVSQRCSGNDSSCFGQAFRTGFHTGSNRHNV